MNPQMLLSTMCATPMEALGCDDLIEALMVYLDGIQQQNGYDSAFSLGQIADPTQTGASSEMAEFLTAFHEANPPLVYWFALLPFRFAMSDLWPEHVKIHNAKVEREYPPERWRRLYC